MRTILAVAFLVALMSPPAWADGVVVRQRIDLRELVKTTAVIFTAIVRKVKPRWATREAYGEKRRYAESFLLEVEAGAWLKGSRPAWMKKTVWLHLPGDPPPGKWVLKEEQYDSSFSPHAAKPGQSLVVFVPEDLGGAHQILDDSGDHVLVPRALDTVERLQDVKKALAPK